MKHKILIAAVLFFAIGNILQPMSSFAQEEVPTYLRDRGTGIPTSQFGTYVRKGQLLLYPFYEYYRDNNLEYEPFDFGFGSIQEYRGRYRANEGIFFISYGCSDKLAAEFEIATISAKFRKSDKDNSAVPLRIEESGLGDVEGQIRWRWNQESAGRPEYFSYFETVFPTGKKHSLIGTSDWEFKLGSGLAKGLKWGTITLRAAVDYSAAEKTFGGGEYALEYLKKLSDHFRIFAMVEGAEDELAVVPELQWRLNGKFFLKANTGLGITSKATDFAPEVGLMFSVN